MVALFISPIYTCHYYIFLFSLIREYWMGYPQHSVVGLGWAASRLTATALHLYTLFSAACDVD